MTHQELTFVLYLAVDQAVRSGGYGREILQNISQTYPEQTIVLDIEALDSSAENAEQRQKRREFYVRNGFHSTGNGFPMRGGER